MGEVEEFNTLAFEKKLMQLKDTQESIQSLSSWCLKQREHHKKIVSSWLNVLKRVKIEQRLVLFYLANDVIQYSKRKNYEFVESWGLNLQKATPLVRDEKVRPKILRIFKIWEQRSVYDDEFLTDLTGLLSAGAVKKTDDDPLDFQPQQLVNKIKQCSVLEADTDLRLKYIHDSHLQLSDADALCANLKDRSNTDDVEKELNEGIACVEKYTQALQREIVAREALLALLQTANQYYSTQRGEVKVVAYAYKNFGARVRALKRKLDEMIPTLPEAAPSPPQRDEDVPSPGPDEDLDLPAPEQNDESDISYNIDRTFNTSISADGSLYNMGLSSFLSSDNPMAMFSESNDPNLNSSANRIEVINNRPSQDKQNFDINDFLKTLVPNENSTASDNNSVGSTSMSQKSQDALPGLDLLSEPPNPPPPTSFYGTMNTLNDDPEPYHPETPQWSSMWSNPPAPVPPVSMPPPVPTPPSLPITSLAMPSLQIPPSLTSLPSLSLPPSLTTIPSSLPSLPSPIPSLPNSIPSLPNSLPTLPTSLPPSLPAPLAAFASPPASPPPAPPPPPHPVPIVPVYSHNTQDMPATDVDHRGILPPPPPPPVLPLLGNMEDVDHRLLPTLPAMPPANSGPRHSTPHQDVDHRNLISLTQNAPPSRDPRSGSNTMKADQDYRVPPMMPPSDIVESVDMDLSEDEDQHAMYQNQSDHNRRHSFNNNNKVLVGGDNGKTNHKEHTNLIQINSLPQNQQFEKNEPHSAPIIPPMTNPFDTLPPMKNFNIPNMPGNMPGHMQGNMPGNMQGNMPGNMQGNMPGNMQGNMPGNMQGNMPGNMPGNMQGNMPGNMQGNMPGNMPNMPGNNPNMPGNMPNMPGNMPPPGNMPFQKFPPNFQPEENNMPFQKLPPNFQTEENEENSNEFENDFEEDLMPRMEVNQMDRLEQQSPPQLESNWQNQNHRQFNNQRFPRNWGPRTNFRPQFAPQFWPRNGPRPPNRWMGPRPQRFW